MLPVSVITRLNLSFTIVFILGVVSLTCNLAQAQGDSCHDILTSGVHNTYQRIRTASAQSALLHELCTSTDSRSSNSSNTGGGGSYGGFGLNFTHGSDSEATLKSQYCGKDANQLSNDDFDKIMQETVDPVIVDNWSKCMAGHGSGLFGKVEANGKQLIFTLEWKGFAGVNEVHVVGDPQFGGITCANPVIKDGLVLVSNVSVKQLCIRNGKDAVDLIVNTTSGSEELQLSEILDDPIHTPDIPRGIEIKLSRKVGSNPAYYLYEGTFTVPAPGPAASRFNHWYVGAVLTIDGNKVNNGPLAFQDGDWHTGDKVPFTFAVPKSSVNPIDGNDVRICVGMKDSTCQLTDNLLTLQLD